jgi:hypothetical protein
VNAKIGHRERVQIGLVNVKIGHRERPHDGVPDGEG